MDEINQRILEKLFHHTNDIVIVIDENGNIESYNETACVFLPTITRGVSISKLLNVDIQDELFQIESPVVKKSIVRTKRQAGGSNRVFLMNAIPLIEEDNPLHYLLIMKDITESEMYKKEIERLNNRIEKLKQSVKYGTIESKGGKTSLADVLEKLEKANKKLARLNLAITRELELASTLQKTLLPSNYNLNKNLKISAHFEPMGHVGGDFFDFVNLPRGRVGVFIADVSGHGVSSAFLAAMLKISFNTWAHRFVNPSKLLEKLNEEYCQVIMTGDYVTAFYLIFDTVRKKLLYSGAGHPQVLLYVKSDDEIKYLPSDGFFIGMFEGSAYRYATEDFKSGCKCIVYTDGLIEAYSRKLDEQFGIERLREVFFKNRKESIPELIRKIILEVKSFTGGDSQSDDIAIVGVEAI